MDCVLDNKKNHTKIGLTSFALHIIAMAVMLVDHIYKAGIINNEVLACIGRIAFPIFAFMIVEGYFHTKNIKKYMMRLLVFALISEIPLNLMVSGSIIYPLHQNVLFTLLISLCFIFLLEKEKRKNNKTSFVVVTGFIFFLALLIGAISFIDYYYAGIYTVFLFYFLRGEGWWKRVLQVIGLRFISAEMIGGLVYPITLFGQSFEIHQQMFSLLSLPLIWLYNGEKGYENKKIKYFFYIFYPLHMIALFLISHFLL